MNLTPTQLAQAAARIGIAEPNPLQQKVWNSTARRLVVLSPTGTGKTLAFAGALLRRLDAPGAGVQAVVLAPSRELAIQINEVLRRFAPDYRTAAFYGNHAMASEVGSLGGGSGPDIVVATPGRLLDHITRGTLDVAGVKALVLDEYDKSLELGFLDEMRRITKRMKALDLVVLTSATKLEEIPDFLPLKGVETVDFTRSGERSRLQIVKVNSPERDKLATLADLLRSLPNGRALVFVNHRESAERVYNFLRKEHFPAGIYHGGLEQQHRQLAVDLFNNGTTPILVSTDLGSRGLDIDDVNYVIHYHLPLSPESWTHRNGRTARMGASGTAYVIIAEEENIPDAVRWDREMYAGEPAPEGIRSDVATLYFNAGKKEKISRGDIAGFLMQKGNLTKDEVGKIMVNDHSAIAAVPRSKAAKVVETVAPYKLKNTKVKISLLK